MDFSSAPYYDRFDPTKNRTRVLFNPNRQLQQSELNELQSIQDYNLRLLGDSFFTDGSILSGMDINKADNTVTIGDGFVYVGGKARPFMEQTVEIQGQGIENIGVKVVQTIVTAQDDPSLKDPTVGVPSSNSDGADRLQEAVQLTLNDPEASTVYTYTDGNLFVDPPKPTYGVINDVLAQRTYEESGSYMVSGFNMWTEANTDNTKITLVIDSGIAYVLGYRINKPTPSRIAIDKSTDTASIQNEGFYYTPSDYTTGKLGNSPVASVSKVAAQIQVNKEGVNRGTTTDGSDYLANGSVFTIDKVWTEDPQTGEITKTYVQGNDYQLQNAQQVQWSPDGDEPDAGTTYYVQYKYTKTMTKDTDYTIDTEGTGDYPDTYIRFDNSTGTKPIENSLVTVDYTFYLSRQDLITLDKNGSFHVAKGQPNTLRLVQSPTNEDPKTLPIGFILVYPNSGNANPALHSIKNLTMEDLQKLSTRVDNIEYNQAVMALDNATMEGKDPLTLRGVFSDGFISDEKADTTNPNMTCAFSFEDAEIWLPYKNVTISVPSVIQNSTTADVWGRLVTAPYTEVKEIDQSLASGAILVNPYQVYNKMGKLTLSPSSDSWIDTSEITTTKTENGGKVNIYRWWYHGGKHYNADAAYLKDHMTVENSDVYTDHTRETTTGTMLENGGQQIKDTLIEYMRSITINFTATNLTPSDDNFYITFDTQRVGITPASGYSSGTVSGTIKSDAKGTAKGSFTIPANVRCGTREVTIQNDNNLAQTTFTAQGTYRVVEDIIIKKIYTVNVYDPLAQSFQFVEDRVVTGIDLYFATKGTDANVMVQIRGMSNDGYPTNEVLAQTVLTPDDINTSDDASAKTTVRFDDPLMCSAGTQYAVTVITDSKDYSMWKATLGEPLINSSAQVLSQPYINGVLFTSSNAATWTADQRSDLKFSIYTARFDDTGVVVFNPITDITMDKVVLMATYLTPQNTGCTWEMKLVLKSEDESVTVDSKDWQVIGNYADYDVNEIAREIQLRATFTSDHYISPMLSLDDITLAAFTQELDGSYIQRTIDSSDSPFNHLTMSFEAFLPQSCTCTPQYSLDGGGTWTNFTNSPTATKASDDFTKYVYTEDFDSEKTSLKFRLTLHAPSSFLRPRARRLMCNWINQ